MSSRRKRRGLIDRMFPFFLPLPPLPVHGSLATLGATLLFSGIAEAWYISGISGWKSFQNISKCNQFPLLYKRFDDILSWMKDSSFALAVHKKRTIGKITKSVPHEIEMVVEREFHKAVSLWTILLRSSHLRVGRLGTHPPRRKTGVAGSVIFLRARRSTEPSPHFSGCLLSWISTCLQSCRFAVDAIPRRDVFDVACFIHSLSSFHLRNHLLLCDVVISSHRIRI